MTNSGLSAMIKSQMIFHLGAPSDDAALQKFCDAMGEAIVSYLSANAQVTASGIDPQGGSVSSTGTIS